ncbi:MAG: alpha/beta hydrolase [Fimbriimonas sp.]
MLPLLIALTLQKPYQVLPLPAKAAEWSNRLTGEDAAVWQTGDVLTFLHRRKAGYVGVTGGVQESMRPVPGTDLWVLQVRMKGWERAVIQYAFFTPERPAPPYAAYRVWRGAQAPGVELARPLKGRLEHVDFESKALGERRRLTVYLPPEAKAGIPAFFVADGEVTEGFAQALEPLIVAGKMRPAAIVGIYSGDWEGRGLRGQEYGRRGGDRYRRHREFFTREVPLWANRTYGISLRRDDRAVVGFSSGGSFAGALASEAPGVFGHVVPLASGSVPLPKAPEPRYFFAVGTLDGSAASTGAAARRVGGSLDTYVGGHDFEIWRLAFSRIAPRVYPSR